MRCQGEWWAGKERGGKAVGEAQTGWTKWHAEEEGGKEGGRKGRRRAAGKEGGRGRRRGQTFVEEEAAEAKKEEEEMEKGLLEDAEEDEVDRMYVGEGGREGRRVGMKIRFTRGEG